MSSTDCGLRRHRSNPKPLIRSHSPDLWLGKHQGAGRGYACHRGQRPGPRAGTEGGRGPGMVAWQGGRDTDMGRMGGIRGLRHKGVLGLDPSTFRL